MTTEQVQSPQGQSPDPSWEHFEVWERVRQAVYALPIYFKSETDLTGLSATDIFTLNAALGATIEDNVVKTLNEIRSVWDPNGDYKLSGFTRQAQTFPDVLLRRYSGYDAQPDIVLGIELKGWYVLAKEEEPSFRFLATLDACAVQDMLVIVPWALSNVIAGSPQIFTPLVLSTRYAAEYRNYYWQRLRRTTLNTDIEIPAGVTPYPKKADQISDKAVADSGGNFGRIARAGIMDDYLREISRVELRGIEIQHWRAFFKLFQEHAAEDAIRSGMERIQELIEVGKVEGGDKVAGSVLRIIEELGNLLG